MGFIMAVTIYTNDISDVSSSIMWLFSSSIYFRMYIHVLVCVCSQIHVISRRTCTCMSFTYITPSKKSCIFRLVVNIFPNITCYMSYIIMDAWLSSFPMIPILLVYSFSGMNDSFMNVVGVPFCKVPNIHHWTAQSSVPSSHLSSQNFKVFFFCSEIDHNDHLLPWIIQWHATFVTCG